MAKNTTWNDDNWLLLMQIYLQKPVGLKPQYSREMVDLSLELHIPPQVLFAKMCEIANLETPRIERIWETYGSNPKKLTRAVRLLREMKGFGQANAFYDGVEVNESFERDWQPLAENERLTPVMLILILDLYFHLTPITMVSETPEVQELARLMKLKADEVTEVLEVYQRCDPYLNRRDVIVSPLLLPCSQIWQRFGNSNTEELASFASQLKEYFRNSKGRRD
jgi:hypothetical protein